MSKKLFLSFLFYGVMILAPAFAMGGEEAPWAKDLEQGQRALLHQRYQEALSAFEKVLKQNPDHLDGLLGMAVSHLGLKHYAESEELLNRLLSLTDKPWQRAEVYGYLGDIQLQKNQMEKALQLYTKALEQNPSHQRSLFNRGYTYFYLKENEKALTDLNLLLSMTPYDRAYYLRGEIYRSKGDLENAEKDFSTAIQLNPSLVEVYFQLAVLWDEKKAYAKEVDLLEQALNYFKGPEVHYYLGRAYSLLYLQMEQSHNLTKRIFRTSPILLTAYDGVEFPLSETNLLLLALEHYEQAKSLGGREKEIALSLGMLLQDLKRYDEAEELYLDWMKKEPQEKLWVMGLARNYTLQGKTRPALATYESVLRLDPGDTLVMDSLAALYYYAGDYQKSLEYSLKAIELNPRMVNLHYNVAFTYKKLKMRQEAKKSFAKVMELEPQSALARIAQAEEALYQRNWKKAESLATEAQVLDPNLADSFYYKGLALFRQGRKMEARLQMEEAIRIEPRDPEYYYQLGKILIDQEKLKAGEQAFAQAALLNPTFFSFIDN